MSKKGKANSGESPDQLTMFPEEIVAGPAGSLPANAPSAQPKPATSGTDKVGAASSAGEQVARRAPVPEKKPVTAVAAVTGTKGRRRRGVAQKREKDRARVAGYRKKARAAGIGASQIWIGAEQRAVLNELCEALDWRIESARAAVVACSDKSRGLVSAAALREWLESQGERARSASDMSGGEAGMEKGGDAK